MEFLIVSLIVLLAVLFIVRHIMRQVTHVQHETKCEGCAVKNIYEKKSLAEE